ncbi:universal stress protein [Thalassotalea ganghwensis]
MSKLVYLVGIDGTEWSERATERAVNLAKDTGASVKLVYVLQTPNIHPYAIEGIVPPPFDDKQEEKFAQEHVIAPLMKKFADDGVKLESQLSWGDPVDVIHKLEKQEHANMVFLGRRGRSTIGDLLLGSVANKLAHHCGVPIVLVP